MLYLTRKKDQAIIINDEIKVTVIDVRHNVVKLGFECPEGTMVLRQELHEKISSQNMNAAISSVALLDKMVIPGEKQDD